MPNLNLHGGAQGAGTVGGAGGDGGGDWGTGKAEYGNIDAAFRAKYGMSPFDPGFATAHPAEYQAFHQMLDMQAQGINGLRRRYGNAPAGQPFNGGFGPGGSGLASMPGFDYTGAQHEMGGNEFMVEQALLNGMSPDDFGRFLYQGVTRQLAHNAQNPRNIPAGKDSWGNDLPQAGGAEWLNRLNARRAQLGMAPIGPGTNANPAPAPAPSTVSPSLSSSPFNQPGTATNIGPKLSPATNPAASPAPGPTLSPRPQAQPGPTLSPRPQTPSLQGPPAVQGPTLSSATPKPPTPADALTTKQPGARMMPPSPLGGGQRVRQMPPSPFGVERPTFAGGPNTGTSGMVGQPKQKPGWNTTGSL